MPPPTARCRIHHIPHSLTLQQLLHFDRLVQENERLTRDLSRAHDAAALEVAQLQVTFDSAAPAACTDFVLWPSVAETPRDEF
jgi:hypothetical protein